MLVDYTTHHSIFSLTGLEVYLRLEASTIYGICYYERTLHSVFTTSFYGEWIAKIFTINYSIRNRNLSTNIWLKDRKDLWILRCVCGVETPNKFMSTDDICLFGRVFSHQHDTRDF